MPATLSTRRLRAALGLAILAALSACAPGPETGDGPYAPGVDLNKPAEDGVIVGNRLLTAGQYELALGSFTRAGLDQGLTSDVLVGMGTANLGLGRLGQAETLLRRSVDTYPDDPEGWNNLGVVPVSYTHLRSHETKANIVCRLLVEKKTKSSLPPCLTNPLITTALHAVLNKTICKLLLIAIAPRLSLIPIYDHPRLRLTSNAVFVL